MNQSLASSSAIASEEGRSSHSNSESERELFQSSEMRKRLQNQLSFGSEQVKLSFHDIQFSVNVDRTKEEIAQGLGLTRKIEVLKGCTGYCLPGQVTFIMGASGAGKTSLLNLLSERLDVKPNMQLTGRVVLNDTHVMDKDLFSSYASYVMQDDVLFAYFTVKEALTFAARLKLHCSIRE